MKQYEISFDMKVLVRAKNIKEAKKIGNKRIAKFLLIAKEKKI